MVALSKSGSQVLSQCNYKSNKNQEEKPQEKCEFQDKVVADARSADKQHEASKWAWLAMLIGKEGRGRGARARSRLGATWEVRKWNWREQRGRGQKLLDPLLIYLVLG